MLCLIQLSFSIFYTDRVGRREFPWLQLPIIALRSAGLSIFPFIVAHILRILVAFLLYYSFQQALGTMLFGENAPRLHVQNLFITMFFWEYYSMMFVRSKASIQIFPRVSLALFLLYLFYCFSYPYGFVTPAFYVLVTLLFFLMLLCVREYESRAFTSGDVSIDVPRALYSQLPWPVWSSALAPDETLFMPVNMEARRELPPDTVPPAVPPAPASSSAPLSSPLSSPSSASLDANSYLTREHVRMYSRSSGDEARDVSDSEDELSSTPLVSSESRINISRNAR